MIFSFGKGIMSINTSHSSPFRTLFTLIHSHTHLQGIGEKNSKLSVEVSTSGDLPVLFYRFWCPFKYVVSLRSNRFVRDPYCGDPRPH